MSTGPGQLGDGAAAIRPVPANVKAAILEELEIVEWSPHLFSR